MTTEELSARLQALEDKVAECVRLLKGEPGAHYGVIERVDKRARVLARADFVHRFQDLDYRRVRLVVTRGLRLLAREKVA